MKRSEILLQRRKSVRRLFAKACFALLLAACASLAACTGTGASKGVFSWGTSDGGAGTAIHDDDTGSAILLEDIADIKPRGLDEELYPYYGILNDSEKVVYEELLDGIEAGAEEVILPEGIFSELSVSTIVTYIAYDQPQLFWYEGAARYTMEGSKVVAIYPKYNDLITDLEYHKSLVEASVDALLAEAAHLSDVEAEKYFYDYLCQNVIYEHGSHDQNIYSAFVEKATVCAGYTHALQYLMMKRGVPCYYCTGWGYNYQEQETGRHAWNIIKLHGNYYNCDVTFGDWYNEYEKYPSYVSYEFFNVSDGPMTDGQHTRDSYGVFLPECTAEDLNYNALYGTDWEYSLPSLLSTDCPYVIDSVDAYIDFLYNWLLTYGSGRYTITFVIRDDVRMQMDNFTNEDYNQRLFGPATDALGLSGWNASLNYTWWPLDGGDYDYMEYSLEF